MCMADESVCGWFATCWRNICGFPNREVPRIIEETSGGNLLEKHLSVDEQKLSRAFMLEALEIYVESFCDDESFLSSKSIYFSILINQSFLKAFFLIPRISISLATKSVSRYRKFKSRKFLIITNTTRASYSVFFAEIF